MDSFLVLPEDIRSNRLTLRGDESKHLARVLRKEIGERVFCTDGNDTMYEAEVASIGSDFVECVIVETHTRFNELPVDITLAVSLLKNPARFDWLVEKATELGVRTIIPMICERTIAKKEKHDRLEKIAVAATKQCGRSYVPPIRAAIAFREILERAGEFELKLIAHERTNSNSTIQRAMAMVQKTKSIFVMIGPEGGFTDEEHALALASQFAEVSLGPRRLRAETAAITALSRIAERN